MSVTTSLDSTTFVREIERSDESVLRVHQMETGDVGVVVWDAALVLLFYLDKENQRQGGAFLRGRTIVELGAGTGVISISAATRGALVVASDLPDLVDLMKRNREENLEAIDSGNGKLKCLALDWTRDLPSELTRTLSAWSGDGDAGENGVTSSIESNAPSSISLVTFPDMILVSDCVYYESSVDALVKTLSALTGPRTLVMISMEDRTSAEKVRVRNKFLKGVESAGFQIARVGFEDMDETFRSPDIHILMMKRKS